MLKSITTNYNYIFYQIAEDYIKVIFNPLNKLPTVEVRQSAIDGSPFLRKLFFLHWSTKINKIITLPFKTIWFERMCRGKFNNTKPTCYLFYGGKYIFDEIKLYKYIKKINKKNISIVYYGDLISKKNTNFLMVKDCVDYIITYDIEESKKYNIHHCALPMHEPLVPITTPNEFTYDVYFLGFAKDRLEQIHNVYRYLRANGLRCKFIICGNIQDEQKIKGEDICYTKPISYLENIQYVQKSKCILEIMQGKSNAATLRTLEAQLYKRKLLTNFQNILLDYSHNRENISIFNNHTEIDIDFLRSPIKYEFFNEDKNTSPIQFIEYLERLVAEKKNEE